MCACIEGRECTINGVVYGSRHKCANTRPILSLCIYFWAIACKSGGQICVPATTRPYDVAEDAVRH